MLSRRRLRCYQSEMDLSSSAAALLAGNVPVQIGHFPLGGGEKLLQLVLEGHVAGRGGIGGLRLCGGPVGGRSRPRGGGTSSGRAGLERTLGGPLRRRQGLFDGKIQLPILNGSQLYFNDLSLLKKIMDVVDIGIGNLRNMYKAGFSALQRYKSAEFGDAGYFSL